jgi:hypothetical protein
MLRAAWPWLSLGDEVNTTLLKSKQSACPLVTGVAAFVSLE